MVGLTKVMWWWWWWSAGEYSVSQLVTECQDNMGVKLNISLLLSLVSVTAAASSLQEDNSEGEARFLFANYTSGEVTSVLR